MAKQKHTPTPWNWVVHDYSMASIEGPNGEFHHVLSVAPCRSCAKCGVKDWKWGGCTTPTLANAKFIIQAVNQHDALMDLSRDVAALCDPADLPKVVLDTTLAKEIAAAIITAKTLIEKEK